MMDDLCSRRFFIGGALASAGAFASSRLFAASGFDGGTPRLKFGIVSDIHLHAEAKGWKYQGDAETFERALEWFRDAGADAVMVCGDIADRGLVEDLSLAAAAWERVFPGNKAPDGRTVEKIFIYGNHDWEGYTYTSYKWRGKPVGEWPKDISIAARGMKATWEEVFHESYEPVFHKVVKGYSFIGAHFDNTGIAGKSNMRFTARVKEFFDAHGKELDPKLPFFYVQHPHPKGTCYGAWAWGHDDGVPTEALSSFPNAFAFSGHSHYPLTDERSVWQGAFTSVGCGSLRYPGSPYDSHAPRGYENTPASKGDARKKFDSQKAMPRLDEPGTRWAMLASVYDDRFVMHRREMLSGVDLLDDWVVPLAVAEPKPFAFAERARKFGSPEFPAGAKLEVNLVDGVRRNKEKTKVWELSFPAPKVDERARVLEYLVSGRGPDNATVERWVIAPGFAMTAKGKSVAKPVKLRVPADEYGERPDFTVTPVSSFGHRGRPI